MKYPAARDDAIKEIMVEPVALPYFYKNKDWYYYDDDDDECPVKLTETAPERAKESYRVYIMGYYDEKLKANVIGDVPPELSAEF